MLARFIAKPCEVELAGDPKTYRLRNPLPGALSAIFRPAITVGGRKTRVLVEQTTVVDPQRLGRSAGRLDAGELRAVDGALGLILGL